MKYFLHYLFLLVSFGAYCQTEASLSDQVIASIQDRINGELNPSIVVGVVDPEGSRYFTFGKKSRRGEVPDEHTVYEIGSISKVFTCIILSKLAADGKVSLADPVQKYLPDSVKMPTRNGVITLEDLATHLSGLPRLPSNMSPADPQNPYADYSLAQLHSFLTNYELDRDIGAAYEYSNLAMGLLGQVIGVASHSSSYEALLGETVVEPLSMSHTGITLSPEMQAKLASGHSLGREVKNWDIPTLAGAGAIRSCLEDMIRFISANLGLVNSSLYDAMTESHKSRHDKVPGNMEVGLGWHIAKGSDGDIIWHNGGTGGYRSFAGFVKEKQKGIVVLTNSTESVDDIGFHLLDTSRELRSVVPYISSLLEKVIENEGLDAAVKLYRDLWENERDSYNFSESILNSLGYYYLMDDQNEAALTVFKLNIERYPESSNTYDSYGEALMKDGHNELAIEQYRKSLELNPGNTNAAEKLAEMGVQIEPDVSLPEDWLEELTGTYKLFPNFDIVITSENRRLFAQATGQARFELFAKSKTEFYYKVVNAQITFVPDDSGVVNSFTLFQNGREMVGKRVE
jgi:D-alanyl-D-alanine-carboxypeptidase/D-alanyl-D-alanine-endopeptidase